MSSSLLMLLSTALAGDLSGIVFGEDGTPLPNTTVSVPSADAATSTDEDGFFELSLPAGEWPLRVMPPGADAVETAPLLVVDDQRTEAIITLTASGLEVLAEEPSQTQLVVEEDVATGLLAGMVHNERGQPVSGAQVFVRGQSVEATSDEAGRFSIELPAGAHEISVLKPGFSTRSVSDVAVPAEGAGTVEIELIEAGVLMDEYVVLMPRISGGTATLIAERQDSADLVETVSAEEMSRRGDSSAASALKRVTGLTVVGGKYVYVRGLGERYAATLLNGSTLPSPEPERRVVPLDLFPTAMLDSVVIQKTFSPSMPAEFGGGMVRLRTRGVPDGPLLKVDLSGSYLSGTTFRDGWTSNDPGSSDFWGAGLEHRALPANVASAIDEEPLTLASTLPGSRGYSSEALEALGDAIPNRWGLATANALPNLSTSIVGGSGWRLRR